MLCYVDLFLSCLLVLDSNAGIVSCVALLLLFTKREKEVQLPSSTARSQAKFSRKRYVIPRSCFFALAS